MPHPKAHWLDDLTTELQRYLEEEPDILADAIMSGGPPPFAATASDETTLLYYKDQFFLPDGNPNGPGRSQVMDRVGTEGYVQVVTVLKKRFPELFPDLAKKKADGERSQASG